MPSPSNPSPMRAIALKVTSVAIFLFMATCIKATENVPPGQLVFFRSFFALLPILVFVIARGDLGHAFKTRRPGGHMLRGVVGVTGMSFLFLALTKLPLPEATVLNYATPLLLVVLSALVLKEEVRLYRWSAVLIGMLGVIIVISPRLTLLSSGAGLSSDEVIGVIAALIGACFAATAMLTTRALVSTEPSATIVIYFSATCSLFALLTSPFGWVMPDPQQWVLLISAGIAGGIAQILLTESYRHADMSIIAPFEYVSLVLSVAVGYLIFGDVPTLQMLVGGLIVVAAGIFVILRERRLGLERTKAKQVSTPQG
ncbi:DMT family transporter [Mariluticola halotolerans]|nr:DMT family transporter [Mariluticola halotolerans]UJQ93611.1 DMT family transporter [Mariluticola halotolerans]